jgi:hypothetical protein
MNETKPAGQQRQRYAAIGRFEIAAGVLLFIYATLSPMISRFYPVLEPEVMFGLWPLVLLFTGFGLVAAGGRLVSGKKWPFLWHVPLAVWIAFSVAVLM